MALVIDDAFGGDDPRLRTAAQAVASMPDWLKQGRLDLWEKHVEAVLPVQDQGSLPMGLLDGVFEFGRFNLYGAFQPKETADEFSRLVARLSQHGLVLDEHQTVSDW